MRGDLLSTSSRLGQVCPLRYSIRNQILIPLIAIQGIAVFAITVTTATLAARRSERQVIDRLNGVIETLGNANFPYTASVLSKMKGLSGAEFIAYSANGRITDSTFSNLSKMPPIFDSVTQTARLDSLGESPTVIVNGVRYFAVSGRSSLLVLYPETSWRQARREGATPPLMLGGGSLVLMAAVTSWIALRISRRVRHVQRQVARIAGGDFEEFDVGFGGDEVSDLAISINSMCVQLRAMNRAIQQSERTRVLAQLAAGLAHQLRNSLTGARMSVQLHARRFPAPMNDQSLNVALRQLSMTEEQVKGLLSLGRVEKKTPAPCDFRRLLDDIALLVDPVCEHAKVTICRPIYENPLEVIVDEAGIRAAVLNLTLNAVEAAGQGGSVRLDIIPLEDTVIIDVADTGPGPPPRLAQSLFEPFTTSKSEGVGLGLAIAHQIAEEHEGDLNWFRVNGETHFHLVIPRRINTE